MHLPDGAKVQHLKTVSQMTVLGSEVSLDWHQRGALSARLRCAWQKWAQLRPQLSNVLSAVAARIGLLDACILPTVLWGLESVPLTTSDRKCLDALQRVMFHRILRLPQRAREPLRDFLRRRERCCTAALRKYSRSTWSHLQRYRALMFMGHLSRLPSEHLAHDVLERRSDRWWTQNKEVLPTRSRRQPGRRAADKSTPRFVERMPRESFCASLQLMSWRPTLWLQVLSRRLAGRCRGSGLVAFDVPHPLLPGRLDQTSPAGPVIWMPSLPSERVPCLHEVHVHGSRSFDPQFVLPPLIGAVQVSRRDPSTCNGGRSRERRPDGRTPCKSKYPVDGRGAEPQQVTCEGRTPRHREGQRTSVDGLPNSWLCMSRSSACEA